MKKVVHLLFFVTCILIPQILFSQPNINDTRMMKQAAISKNNIAFIYANDLWIADKTGSNVRRLTVDQGVESNPIFSPDGKTIAFNAQYDSRSDIYTIPVEGGVPKRLTYHPGNDIIRGFTKDGSGILFVSQRESYTDRYYYLYTMALDGAFPKKLNLPSAWQAVFSPDGKYLAYTPISERHLQWKHYRGGTVSNIKILNLSNNSVEKIPQPEGYCNDTDPMWIGDKIFFASDRNGEFNLFSYDTKTKEIKQLTNYNDFPVLSPSASDTEIIYEQAGYLYVTNLSDGKIAKLTIGIGADLLSLRETFVKGANFNSSAHISPNGARAVFELRGDIVTVPAEKGDPRNITNTSGTFERSPVWSPDGQNIAYFSDESGEYELHIQKSNGKGEIIKYKMNGSGFYYAPKWSPDNSKIYYYDNSNTYFYIDLKTNKITKIDQLYYGLPGNANGEWSPDSKWIVYTNQTKVSLNRIFVYSLLTGKSYPITDGMSDALSPVFDKSGKYIYFLASTEAGPARQWLELSSQFLQPKNNIYLIVLSKDSSSPFKKESDEEKINDTKEKVETPEKNKTADKPKKDLSVKIDVDGIENRIISVPVPKGFYSDLKAGNEGELYYLEQVENSRGKKLHKYDLKSRKDDVALQSLDDYEISENRTKILYLSGGDWKITGLGGKIETDKGKLNLDQITITVKPQKEWQQMFNETWRINRDYFYDPNMHGADWNKMKEKYKVFLPHLSCKSDLDRVLRWMMSELAVGHSYLFSLSDFPEPSSDGLLGADYTIENGRYKFKKIFGGLTWTPELRAPLMEPGLNIKPGEYLLAVNGKNLSASENIYRMFENTSGKITEITVGPNTDGTNSRVLSVVPINSENSLRNRDWVEGNMKRVHEATNGKVAYIYLPNTSTLGYEYFRRYFFPQGDKDAIIIDERFNGGGSVADYYIDILKRQYICSNTSRYGADQRYPGPMILGPKVMLIDETAASGGDLLPWMFKKFKMGKIIGKRTWGGLVGNSGFPRLIDGTYITAPNLGLWAGDEWICENVGVSPDIEVEQTPVETLAGKDPQLEKAIQVVLEELKNNPVKEMKHPPFPVKVKK